MDELENKETNEEKETILNEDFFDDFEDNTTGDLESDLLEELNKINEESNIEKEPIKEEKTNNKKKLTKKQLIIICVIGGILLISLVFIIIYMVIPKDQEEPVAPVEEEHIVIDNGNYKYEDGTLVFLNDNKTEIGKYECSNKDENSCYVAYLSNNSSDINVVKNVYEDNSEVQFRSSILHNRYVFISDGNSEEIILYDMLENKSIKTYKSMKYYTSLGSDYVILEDTNNLYGLVKIDSNDITTILNFEYKNINYLDKKDNKLVVNKNNKYYVINLEGKSLTKAVSSPIYDYSDKYLVLKNNNKYSLVDYDNKEIYSDYNYISIINDEYVSVVLDDNIYIKDYENNKYNEVGYSIVNFDYSGVNKYSSDGTLLSNSYSYKVSLNDTTMTIFIKDNNDTTEYTLNLRDGLVSKNVSYYSNFDGILYFYSDEDKENLIGSYICTNKNDTTNSDTLNTCQVAVNYIFDDNFKNNGKGLTDKVLPIVSNRYVFISDSLNGLDSPVIFYDLVSNKTIATYQHLSISDTFDTLSFVDSLSNVIIENRSGKFGYANITSKGVDKIYDFVYDGMERIGNEILVYKNSKYQILYSNKSTSAETTNKIYDYTDKYFVTKDSNGYSVYEDTGSGDVKLITKVYYKVIKLVGDTCYITIDNNLKVEIYLYDGTLVTDRDVYVSNETEYHLYNMVSASKIDNTIILNTFDNEGTRTNSYTFNIPSKQEEKDPFEVITNTESTNETTE